MISYSINKSDFIAISEHLYRMDSFFVPKLSSYVSIDIYAEKLANKAERFEAFHSNKLIGLIAGYYNDEKESFYISNFSIEKEFQGQGVSSSLFNQITENFKSLKDISLEVKKVNTKAIEFYKKIGFVETKEALDILILLYKI